MEYIAHKLTKSQRVLVENKLKSLYTLPARIESLKERSAPSITAGYKASEVQRNSRPSSNVEKAVILLEQLRQAEAEQRLLLRIREELEETDPDLNEIWNLRYRPKFKYTDNVVIEMMRYGNRNTYYEAKDKLLGIVADRLSIWRDY
ncbi:hypothetical protein [Exiguobacterium sp. s191]|uniref:hypothetical protein n=1 Tax=Exiguobacterium sp. s191 TaxID=2751196 RepID=UPI001BE8B9D0|nr:hypothetical protein [Exiguobacterium sp. s191]